VADSVYHSLPQSIERIIPDLFVGRLSSHDKFDIEKLRKSPEVALSSIC
jgi:hypothetical protein